MKLDQSLSAYLDLLRFTAASAVLLGHMEQDGLYMRWLPLSWFSHEAVMIFFVMSGFIIYSSTVRSARTWADYAAARLSRVYSVALPAVVFSVGLGLLVGLSGEVDTQRLSNYRDFSAWDVASSLMFLNEAFANKAALSLNHPYWSLCYEVWYYVLFGLFLFLRGWQRGLCLVLGLLVAGPAVLALFPIWVIGALLAAHADGEGRLQAVWAWLAYFGSLAVIVGVNVSGVDHAIRIYLHDHIPGFWRLGASQRLVTDYLIGLAVVLHILSFSGLNPGFRRFFGLLAPLAKYLAGFSFTLYLFHRPMTQLAGYAFPNTAQSIAYSLAGMLAILLACLLISYGTERQLGAWRAFFVTGLRKLPVFSSRP